MRKYVSADLGQILLQEFETTWLQPGRLSFTDFFTLPVADRRKGTLNNTNISTNSNRSTEMTATAIMVTTTTEATATTAECYRGCVGVDLVHN